MHTWYLSLSINNIHLGNTNLLRRIQFTEQFSSYFPPKNQVTEKFPWLFLRRISLRSNYPKYFLRKFSERAWLIDRQVMWRSPIEWGKAVQKRWEIYYIQERQKTQQQPDRDKYAIKQSKQGRPYPLGRWWGGTFSSRPAVMWAFLLCRVWFNGSFYRRLASTWKHISFVRWQREKVGWMWGIWVYHHLTTLALNHLREWPNLSDPNGSFYLPALP